MIQKNYLLTAQYVDQYICWYQCEWPVLDKVDFTEGPKSEPPVRKSDRWCVEMGQPVWIHQCPISTCAKETVDLLISIHQFQWGTKIRATCSKKWPLMCWNGSTILDSPVSCQYLCKNHRWSVDIDAPISVRDKNQSHLFEKVTVDVLKWVNHSGFTSVLSIPL